MSTTPNLLLPRILAGQAQKHVTHNEALRSLDGLVHSRSKTGRGTHRLPIPWTGHVHRGPRTPGRTAGWREISHVRADAAWHRLPRAGFLTWVEAEGVLLVREGGMGATRRGPLFNSRDRPRVLDGDGNAGSAGNRAHRERGRHGARHSRPGDLPWVTTKVITAITGRPHSAVGQRHNREVRAALGVSAGSSNSGVIGPSRL